MTTLRALALLLLLSVPALAQAPTPVGSPSPDAAPTPAAMPPIQPHPPQPPASRPRPAPSPSPAPAGAGHLLYVDGKPAASVTAKWLEVVGKRPELAGSVYVKPAEKGWTGLAIRGLEKMEPEKASGASKALSDLLDTHVLHLAVTPDGRAWYFLWKDGKLVDRYCSNPGRPEEIPNNVLRSWQGRPELLLPVCRGRPLSKNRTEVSLTDFNGFLYFYYPEMKTTKPASWRSATEVMRLLAQVVGVSQPPAPFATVATLRGWKRL